MMTTLLVVSWIVVVLFALVQTARAWFWRWLALAWHADLLAQRTTAQAARETRARLDGAVIVPAGAAWDVPREEQRH